MPHRITSNPKLKTPPRPRNSKKNKQQTTAPVSVPARVPGTEEPHASVQQKWTNQEIAALLYRIADILDIQGEIRFKAIAYRRAADVIEHLSRGVQEIWAGDAKNLLTIHGIGAA